MKQHKVTSVRNDSNGVPGVGCGTTSSQPAPIETRPGSSVKGEDLIDNPRLPLLSP